MRNRSRKSTRLRWLQESGENYKLAYGLLAYMNNSRHKLGAGNGGVELWRPWKPCSSERAKVCLHKTLHSFIYLRAHLTFQFANILKNPRKHTCLLKLAASVIWFVYGAETKTQARIILFSLYYYYLASLHCEIWLRLTGSCDFTPYKCKKVLQKLQPGLGWNISLTYNHSNRSNLIGTGQANTWQGISSKRKVRGSFSGFPWPSRINKREVSRMMWLNAQR